MVKDVLIDGVWYRANRDNCVYWVRVPEVRIALHRTADGQYLNVWGHTVTLVSKEVAQEVLLKRIRAGDHHALRAYSREFGALSMEEQRGLRLSFGLFETFAKSTYKRLLTSTEHHQEQA